MNRTTAAGAVTEGTVAAVKATAVEATYEFTLYSLVRTVAGDTKAALARRRTKSSVTKRKMSGRGKAEEKAPFETGFFEAVGLPKCETIRSFE